MPCPDPLYEDAAPVCRHLSYLSISVQDGWLSWLNPNGCCAVSAAMLLSADLPCLLDQLLHPPLQADSARHGATVLWCSSLLSLTILKATS